MLDRIFAAYRGGRLWKRISREHRVAEGVYVVVLAEDDVELNTAALGHVDELVDERYARGVVLIRDRAHSQTAAIIGDSVPTLTPPAAVIATEAWSSEDIDALMSFYELDNGFTNRLLVVSLTRPFGNGLHRLLDRHGVTKEDLVCLGCLRLRGYGVGSG